MKEIIFSFQKDDLEFKKEVETFFKNQVEFIDISPFDGLNIITLAIIPITSLTIQIADFIKTHLTNGNNNDKKRVIISKSGDINLTGYSGEEVDRILKTIYGEK